MGLWTALEEAFSDTRHQRCWVHKSANVLKLPKSVQSDAKRLVHEIHQSPPREAAHKVYKRFLSLYQDRYEKACECLTKDDEILFTFYDYPATHWIHLRTTNPIELTFATVRHCTGQTMGCGSVKATMAMVYKLALEAKKTWVRLRGYRLIPFVIDDVKFHDGELKPAA